MKNEQLITVKVRVPVGDECVPDKGDECTFLMYGERNDCRLLDIWLDGREKCQPCKDACKEEVARDKSDYNYNEPA